MANRDPSETTTNTTDIDRDTLCRDHLPLVHHEVASFLSRLPRHVSRDDLVSSGMAALVLAARSFDPSYGVPFARFAARRIRGAIIDEMRAADWASRSVRARVRQRDQAFDRLCAQLGRMPSAQELAAELGVDPAELDAMDGDVQRAVVLSYHAMDSDEAVDAMLPRTQSTPESILIDREQLSYLHDAIAALPDRLRTVIIGYYFEDKPMREIAEELDVTESRISHMRAEALSLVHGGLTTHLEQSDQPRQQPTGVAARRREAYFAEIAARSDYRARLSLPQQRRSADSAARTA